jgi:ribonuclease HI
MKNVEMIVDGSARPNPGAGGWCCILRFGSAERVLTGAEGATTNNRMELTAAIEGLSVLREPCHVEVTSDSEYVVKGMSERIIGWQASGWRTRKGEPVLNRDLWERLYQVTRKHDVRWRWVRGHDPHNKDQNRADQLAASTARDWAGAASPKS